MGATTNGAICETTGEEQNPGTWDRCSEGCDEWYEGLLFHWRGYSSNRLGMCGKRGMVTTGTGREVFIKPGVSLIGRVLLTSDKIGFAVGVSFERRAIIQELVEK